MNSVKRRYSTWLRWARLITHYYEQFSLVPPASHHTEIVHEIRNLQRKAQRIDLARSHKWNVAEERTTEDYRRQLRRLNRLIQTELSLDEPPRFSTSEAEVFRDLQAIHSEFDEVSLDREAMKLAVVTKDIELDGFALGAYRIELDLTSLSSLNAANYDVIAIDNNSAFANDGVTHPHVQNGALCEGDAQPAIRLSLQQCRLLDFFQLVENVLSTYNPSSAYVTIAEWEGESCTHCGHTMHSDQPGECFECDAMVCADCVSTCHACGEAVCGNCEEACGACLEHKCKSCVSGCVDCDERCCCDCLSENERCVSCEEKAKEEKSGTTELEVHCNGVGEAVVSA